MLTGALGRTDPVVGVLVCLLLLASVFSWAIILSRVVGLRRFGRALVQVEAFARQPGTAPAHPSHLFAALVAADDAECAREPDADRGQREIAMRAAYLAELRQHEAGLPFLATLASSAPFVGLFGTVWGIMESFSSIAAANDTSLSVVAPGIAGALFATAVGLAAAIPAVVAYNLIRAQISGFSHRLAAAAFLIARDVKTVVASKAA